MLYAGGFVGIVLTFFWIYCLIDVIMTPASSMRNLPKLAWVLIVIFLFDIGAVVWLIAGRPRRDAAAGRQAPPPAFPEYERSNRASATNPDDDKEFLRQCRERAQAQRERWEVLRKQDEPPQN